MPAPILTASPRSLRTISEITAERGRIKTPGYYILEVAYPKPERPNNDPTRFINGVVMTVATMRLCVHSAVCGTDYIAFDCSGQDAYGYNASGTYYYYQSPSYMRGDRPFVLSVTPA
ncbi:MAG: hypothetical protein IJU51_00420 [Clostridia bacterium]|nr:hypothetical protein [Clostridia bacterium]